MGASDSSQDLPALLLLEEQSPPTATPTPTGASKKLALIPLVFLIFFEVSGGPYGEESAVGAAGPLWAILGFLIFPFVWSIPEALVTAELATTFPGNGGYVIWAHQAFGPFWGSLMGSLKFLSGVINLASYPVLCVDYIKLLIPILSSGVPRYSAILITTSVLSFLNYTGLAIVGYTAVTLGVLAILPFIALTLFSIPKIKPIRWISLGQKGVPKDWTLYFNTLFWNLNFWDNASTLAGEVENPQKTYPKALFSAGLLTCLAYLVPLLASTGAVPLNQDDWVDGYFATVGGIVGGLWLKLWIELGAVLSTIGLYEAQLSSSGYQFLGMADLGFLPQSCGKRSTWFDTPWVGILVSTLITVTVSYMDFEDLISSANFLYSLGMLLEFASFIWLRKKMPTTKRPFRVPMGMAGLVFMCLVPSGFLVYVMTVATTSVLVVSAILIFLCIVWYYAMKLCKSRMWVVFSKLDNEYLD